MKTNWTQQSEKTVRLKKTLTKQLWSLWGVVYFLLLVWFGFVSSGHTYGGWIYSLLALALLLAVFSVCYDLIHAEHFKNISTSFKKRVWKFGPKSR